ncbi:DHHC palmitoyltransferase-domain-containing protein [Phycomyces nitens]|nr:DHHC palmitoyltransferase-domain-containing protein [Phycomyces nitens]
MRVCTCSSLEACQQGLMRAVNASPVVLLILIFGWCYWAYIFRLCWSLIADKHIAQGVLYIIFFQPIFILCIWSFWKITRTSPGYSNDNSKRYGHGDEENPEELYDANEDMQLLNHHMDDEEGEMDKAGEPSVAILNVEASESTTSLNRTLTSKRTPVYRTTGTPITVKRCGETRFCKKCQLHKFDRSHHCRMCKRCVLKMDHHCPWVNNCVGFRNYKFFYNFLVFATFLCVFIFSTTLPPTIRVLNQPLSIFGLDFNWVLLVFVSVIFGIFLIPFTLFHTRQLFKNRTTIEFYEKSNFKLGRNRGRHDVMRSKYFNPWDLGTKANIEQVLGPNWMTWFLPIGQPKGNGHQFPINKYAYDTLDTEGDDDF